ncbi:MAG: LysM peptidoglycan-binding domain-containing protein [Deltaproteobacteria bacterium]|nr:LysM peptidoglycan-binding domain-containing protein [Deltaproteobacteria bacterium]
MPIPQKNISAICLVICLSVITFFILSFSARAQNVDHNGTLVFAKEGDIPEQSRILAQMTTDSNSSRLADKKASNEEDEEEVEDEQDLMEKALELLELADKYWKNGDLENTVNTLDKAYALVLDTNGDVEIARQKDDLRLLISRRILALYSSQQRKTNGKASEIPMVMNADVEKEIRSFQGPERDFFISSYQRSGLYRDIIVGELRQAGIPEEFFWLPLVESGFKVCALSSARALGLWQFIPSTGYKFGLTRDEWIDERMDVLKSTHAAIAYLKELHSMFGDWLTVLAAYNCGEGRVLRVISRQRINYFDRFWDLYSQLPNETARYVPRFLATLQIIKNPEKYGFELHTSTESLLNYETVTVNKMMKLTDVASKMEISEDCINVLNAELRYKITPDREYLFKVPQGSLEKFNMVYNDIPDTERPRFIYSRSAYIKHRVRPGETVASIAKRYKVSTQSIFASNRINTKKRLAKGQIIRIPVNRTETVVVRNTSSSRNKNAAAHKTSGAIQSYKVKSGDSLAGIAKRFQVPVAKLKEINKLKTNTLQAGRTLKIPAEAMGNNDGEKRETKNRIQTSAVGKSTVAGKTLTAEEISQLGTDKHIVTKGDNLSVIARKYDIELAKLIEMNNLSGRDSLTPGQVLTIR